MVRKSILRPTPVTTKANNRLMRLTLPHFCGWAAAHEILEVSGPFRVCADSPERSVTLADQGYTWVTLLPDTAFLGLVNIAFTGLYAPCTLLEIYVDIIAGKGVDNNGVPWFDDLYIDAVLRPSENRIDVLDRDELNEALSQGVITHDEHALAIKTCRLAEDSLRSYTELWLQTLQQAKAAFEKNV